MKPGYIIELALRSSLMKLLRKQDRLGTNLREEKKKKKVPFRPFFILFPFPLSSFPSPFPLLFSFLPIKIVESRFPLREFTRRRIRGNASERDSFPPLPKRKRRRKVFSSRRRPLHLHRASESFRFPQRYRSLLRSFFLFLSFPSFPFTFRNCRGQRLSLS